MTITKNHLPHMIDPNYKYRPRRRKNGRKGVPIPGQPGTAATAVVSGGQTNSNSASNRNLMGNNSTTCATTGGNANAIRRWTAFNQTQQPNRARVDEENDGEELDEVVDGSDDDDDGEPEAKKLARASNGIQMSAPSNFNNAATCYDYDDNPYSTSAGPVTGLQNSLPMGGNLPQIEQVHTPDSSPNSSPYSSVSSAKNFHITHHQNSNNNNGYPPAQDNTSPYNRYVSGTDFQSSNHYQQPSGLSHLGARGGGGVYYMGQQQQPPTYHHISTPYAASQQAPQPPANLIHHPHHHQQQLAQHSPHHLHQSSQQMPQYYPQNPPMMHQQQAVNLSSGYGGQQAAQNYPTAGTNIQSAGQPETMNGNHTTGLGPYGQPSSAMMHPNALLPPAEQQTSTMYGGGGGNGNNNTQFSNSIPSNNQQQMLSDVSGANNSMQLYELQSRHEQQQHENLTPLDVTKNHDMRQQQHQLDDFQAANAPTNNQQPGHGSPLNYNDGSNLTKGCSSSASSQAVSSNHNTSSTATSHEQVYAGIHNHNNNHHHHQQQQQQQLHNRQRTQQMFGSLNQSNSLPPFDYQTSMANLSVPQQPGAMAHHHHQIHFQADNSNHAAVSSTTSTKVSGANSSSPYNLTTASPSSTNMSYNHGQLPNGGNEYNLTTLQATRLGQNQYVTHDGNNQSDQKRQDVQVRGSPMSDNLQQQQQQQQQHRMARDHHGQVVTANMMLMDSNSHSACNNKVFAPVALNGQQQQRHTLVSSSMVSNQHLESIAKSFPTPEMSPLDSPDKSHMFNQQQQLLQHNQHQHHQASAQQYRNAISSDETESNNQQQSNSIYPYHNQPEHNQQSQNSSQQQNDRTTNTESGASAVSQLIARFGEQSSVLKSVQPPYKYRMIVSTSVASSLTDLSIQQQMRDTCNGEQNHNDDQETQAIISNGGSNHQTTTGNGQSEEINYVSSQNGGGSSRSEQNSPRVCVQDHTSQANASPTTD